ncbi:hypothetical protein cyc_08860 [Cyclospora cayetanensis]|uniref:Uncharacterized protein n=1 Tax=Cyclospora cayetanensis TaxID=88456 RepID=A0A1D3CX32_9EIME|nr:hypothetical protein cyc_08860 [Cyclospora cayetanensis]
MSSIEKGLRQRVRPKALGVAAKGEGRRRQRKRLLLEGVSSAGDLHAPARNCSGLLAIRSTRLTAAGMWLCYAFGVECVTYGAASGPEIERRCLLERAWRSPLEAVDSGLRACFSGNG